MNDQLINTIGTFKVTASGVAVLIGGQIYSVDWVTIVGLMLALISSFISVVNFFLGLADRRGTLKLQKEDEERKKVAHGLEVELLRKKIENENGN